MKLIKQYKTFSIFIFILYLLIVFLLFAYVNNSEIVLSGEHRVLVDFMFLLVIAFGAFMFYLAERKNDMERTDTSKPKLAKDTDQGVQKDQMHNSPETEEETQLLDVKRILPQSSTNLEKYGEELLKNMADEFNIVQALFYFRQTGTDVFQCRAQFAYYSDTKPADFKFGETISGQAVKNKKTVSLSKVPDSYLTVVSGLGKGAPKEIVFLPIIFDGDVV